MKANSLFAEADDVMSALPDCPHTSLEFPTMTWRQVLELRSRMAAYTFVSKEVDSIANIILQMPHSYLNCLYLTQYHAVEFFNPDKASSHRYVWYSMVYA